MDKVNDNNNNSKEKKGQDEEDEEENLSDSSESWSDITPKKNTNTDNKNSKSNTKNKSRKILKSSDEDSDNESAATQSSSSSESENANSVSSKDSDFKKRPQRSTKTSKNNDASNSKKKVKYSSDEDTSEEEDDDESSSDSSEDSNDESSEESGDNFELSESDENSDEDDDDSDDEDYFEFNRRSKRIKSKKKNASVNNNNNKNKTNNNSTRYPQRGSNKTNNSKNNSTKKASSTRSTTSKKINYCEDSDDDITDSEDYIYSNEPIVESNAKIDDPNVETIEKVLKCRYGRTGATGSKTAIYNIEEHGDPNDSFNKEKETGENQYFIKWQGWSHLHNTWESKESLLQQRVKGIKKLENFLKKEEENRHSVIDPSSPEDLEFLECQNEMLDNLLETHRNVERIIANNQVKNANGPNSDDYLCKWQGLPYSECTWEDGELIKKRFPKLIEEFEKRQSATTLPPISVKTQRALRQRPKFVALKEKPAYLGNYDPELKLRDYQLDGLNWLANSWCRQNSVILADEMGLGKTIQTISFISYVFNEHSLYGPFLIVIPLSTIQGWQRELQKWSPEMNVVVYLGDAQSRDMIQKYEWYSTNKKIKANVVLTTYEILLKDKSFFNSVSWAVLIVDEAHRLKNEDSLLYQSLIKFDTNHRLLITGTPLQNSLKELWALIHFIMPEKFYSWEDFDRKYSSVLSDGLRFQDLHKELQPYLLRRVKKDVEKSLPSKVEQILRVEMTNIQKQFYKLVLTKNYKELSKGAKGNVNSFLNIMMELKKCSNHIYLIRRDETTTDMEKLIKGSGKLLLLDKLLRRLKETGHRVLIFSQMVRMLDILAEYLQYRRFQFQRLDGSIKGEIRRQALDHFNKEDSEDFCFLLSTRAGGLGINLATADTVIIYDSDWNPQNDLQAQARAHRIGQKNQVNIYRLVSKNSIEEDIVERAKKKMVLDHLVIQSMDTTGRTVLNKSNSAMPFTKEEVNSILKFGAEELFKEKDPNEQDDKEELNMYDIDEILKRAETREEDNHLSASEELLSQFKVANFSTVEDDPILPTFSSSSNNKLLHQNNKNNNNENQIEKSWNEIIPEEDRLRIEMEEENEKINQLNLTLGQRRNRGTLNQKASKSAASSDDEVNDRTLKNDHSDDQEEDYDEYDKLKKKRNQKSNTHAIKGLNGQELRKFIRSYRKFPCPLERIDMIAQDSHLEEKSQACLIEFAQQLQMLCKKAISENDVKKQEIKETNNDEEAKTIDKKKKKRPDRESGPCFVLNGVKLNAQQILEAEIYFEPLTHYLKDSAEKKIEFKSKLKQTYWDCDWNEEDDKALLTGIYDYGYGNWDWIKADPKLNLDKKILICKNIDENNGEQQKVENNNKKASNKNTKLKPQSKHLRTRIDYLVKVLKNQINIEKYGENWKDNTNLKNSRKTKKKNRKDDNLQEHSLNNSIEKSETASLNESANVSKSSKRKLKTSSESKPKRKHHNENNVNNKADSDESDHSESNHENKKKRNHHHHHHHNNDSSMSGQFDEEMQSDNETSHKNNKKSDSKNNNAKNSSSNNSNKKEKKIILSEKTFNECKNLMRPVKNALKNIDIKGGSLSEKDNIERIKLHLLEIGDKINDHLSKYSDPDKIKEWRNYLWIFVSKFTTIDYEKVKKLYQRFASTRDQLEMNKHQSNNFNNMNNSNTPNSRYYSSTSSYNNQYSKYDSNHKRSSLSGSGGDYWKSEKHFKNDHHHGNHHQNHNSNFYKSSNNNNSHSNRYHHDFGSVSSGGGAFNHSFNGFESNENKYDHKNFSTPSGSSNYFLSKKSSFNSPHTSKYPPSSHHQHQHHHSHQHGHPHHGQPPQQQSYHHHHHRPKD